MAYNTTLSRLVNIHAPLLKKTITLRPHAPRYTDELRQAKRKRCQCERKWIHTQLEAHRQIYREQCGFVNKLLPTARKDYYEDKILKCGRDQKSIYKVTTQLLGKSKSSLLPRHGSNSELAEQFNDFFNNKIITIGNSLVSSTAYKGEPEEDEHMPKLSFFTHATLDEINEIVTKSPNKSCSLDPLPTWLLKKCLDSLLPSITHIINQSFLVGEVPRELKTAHIRLPLKKPGLDVEALKNYIPVSNLYFLATAIKTNTKASLSSIDSCIFSNIFITSLPLWKNKY